MATPMIIDTDPGVDDAMAIAFAVAHPEIDLVGITTVFGNVSVVQATENALALLSRFGAGKVPVAKGAAVPLTQDPLPHPDFVHGQNGLGNVEITATGKARAPVSMSAAQFIVDQANVYQGELVLVAVGPLTNVALAIRLDPELPRKLKQLVIMGGTVDEPGNVSPVAEANFLNDPHSADIVMGAGGSITVVGLDVTHKVILSDTSLMQLRDNAGDTGKILWDTSRFYVSYYSSTGAASGMDEPGCCMHDAAAVAFVVAPELFEVIQGPARVVTDGVGAGQLTINRKGYTYLLKYWENRPPVAVCMQVKAEELIAFFLGTLVDHHLR